MPSCMTDPAVCWAKLCLLFFHQHAFILVLIVNSFQSVWLTNNTRAARAKTAASCEPSPVLDYFSFNYIAPLIFIYVYLIVMTKTVCLNCQAFKNSVNVLHVK